jgi:membrane-bound lytic murein transglycosylase B
MLLLMAGSADADFSGARADRLLDTLAHSYDFSAEDQADVRRALAAAHPLPQVLPAEINNKEKTLTWDAYAPIHVNPANIVAGKRFMHEQKQWLDRAEAEYGVPPQIIVALLGVETRYGRVTGHFRAIDALATLAFSHPTRADFFLDELTAYFVLCRKFHFDPLQPKSSYAGALGAAQFMPSSYLKLAIDYDGDGRIDLWSPADAIGSIANYLTHYRPASAWRRGEPVYLTARLEHELAPSVIRNGRATNLKAAALQPLGIEASAALPPEFPVGLVELSLPQGADYWIGLPNFYSVMSYNPRVFYAAAVAELADALAAPDVVASR